MKLIYYLFVLFFVLRGATARRVLNEYGRLCNTMQYIFSGK